MLHKPAQAIIEDITGVLPVTLDVNFDENYKDCVQITLGRQKSIIKYSDLFAFMFAIAKPEQQSQMIPVQQELGHQYMKQIRVKLTKDLKEGEEMVVNVPINVPQIIEDSMKEEIKTPYLEN